MFFRINKKLTAASAICVMLLFSALTIGYAKPAEESFKPVSISYDAATDMHIGYSSLSVCKPQPYSVKRSASQSRSVRQEAQKKVKKAISAINKPVKKRNYPKNDILEAVCGSGVIAAVEGEMTGAVLMDDHMAESLTAEELGSLTETGLIERMGPIFTEIQRESGILASVNLAQFILESGYSRDGIALSANNMFGMKTELSGNTWDGSTWDGISIYNKATSEQDVSGNRYETEASFRAYPDIRDSLADHTAYLLGAYNGDFLRYVGLKGNTDYRSAALIIQNGGYGTDTSYADKLCRLIEKWELTRFDIKPDLDI